MKIQVKNRIYDVPPTEEWQITNKLRDAEWCKNFFGPDYFYVAFEPYIILDETDGSSKIAENGRLTVAKALTLDLSEEIKEALGKHNPDWLVAMDQDNKLYVIAPQEIQKTLF